MVYFFFIKTSRQFFEKYSEQLDDPKYENLPDILAPALVYDTTWALALGLDKATKKVAEVNESGCEGLFGDVVPLEEFNYTNQKMGCILKSSFAETNFTGLTVSI